MVGNFIGLQDQCIWSFAQFLVTYFHVLMIIEYNLLLLMHACTCFISNFLVFIHLLVALFLYCAYVILFVISTLIKGLCSGLMYQVCDNGRMVSRESSHQGIHPIVISNLFSFHSCNTMRLQSKWQFECVHLMAKLDSYIYIYIHQLFLIKLCAKKKLRLYYGTRTSL